MKADYMSQSHSRNSRFPQPEDTVRVGSGDDELVAVVVKVGIGLEEDGSGVEIVKAKVGDGEIRNFFAAACEVITRADGDRETAGEDGGTLEAAVAGDAVVEQVEADDSAELITDDELDRLTAPDDTLVP